MDDESTAIPDRLRLMFAAPLDRSKPIHALRTGTFADSMGRETTFTPDDLRQMAERLNAGAQKRKPPINEGHDYGRAVGRMLEAYTRHGDNHLYIVPKWNTEGQRLLSDEVYDAFSIELDTAKGYTVIGGALTNYPAVSGLHPVSLNAPETGTVPVISLPPADEPAADEHPTEEHHMSDETQAAPAAVTSATPPAPPAMPTLDLSDPMVQNQLSAYTSQMQAYMRQQHEQMMQAAAERARAEFEQWKAAEGKRAALLTFSQHATTPTLERPTTIAYSVEQMIDILSAPTADKVRQVFEDALSGVLVVSASPAGSSRGDESGGDKARFDALVFEKQRTGMNYSDAIKAVSREHPALYQAMNQPKGGR